MPNIIEQQDLLKGLPDTRLAMLLQNPVGDIPPFLVAAEAQRRQAIRQQFAGSENKESVVDSLTKQLANVPQNIPAPTRTPPMVPPTPQMQGVAALQAQQAVQQMAQPQQMMRGGGMVQRYQAAGLVQQSANPAIENMARTYMMLNPGMTYEEAVQRASIGSPLPTVDTLASTATNKAQVGNFDVFPPVLMTPDMYDTGQAEDLSLPDVPIGGARPVPPKPRPRPDDLVKPAPGETEDEFRARLEALYTTQGPSNWEKAQRYFAMAEQFLDPSKTTMQSVAGAGQAFAQSSAEQARAQREAELAREKGMLEYDIAKAEELRAEKMREAEAKAEALKARTGIATGQLDDLRRERRDIAEAIRDIKSRAVAGGLADDPSVVGQIEVLQKAYDDLGRQITSFETFISETYGFPLIETADLSNGQILPPRR